MIQIFISYRPGDSNDITKRIAFVLQNDYFGSGSVFVRSDREVQLKTITTLRKRLHDSDIMLVIIGPHWNPTVPFEEDTQQTVPVTSKSTKLDNPADITKLEIEIGTEFRLPGIPVLVQGAVIPDSSQLPPGLRLVASKDPIVVRDGADFQQDMSRLVERIKRETEVALAQKLKKATRRRFLMWSTLLSIALMTLLVSVIIIVIVLNNLNSRVTLLAASPTLSDQATVVIVATPTGNNAPTAGMSTVVLDASTTPVGSLIPTQESPVTTPEVTSNLIKENWVAGQVMIVKQGQGTSLRVEPKADGFELKLLTPGNIVTIIHQNENLMTAFDGLQWWWKVEVANVGYVGWVEQSMLEPYVPPPTLTVPSA